MSGAHIEARLYLDSCRVEHHLGRITPYQEFFYSQDSNPRPLIKGGAAPSAALHSLVVTGLINKRYKQIWKLLNFVIYFFNDKYLHDR